MPFIPHTEEEIREMLSVIGADRIEELFDEIPASLRIGSLDGVPEGIGEMEVARLMHERALQDGLPLNFIGAGAYEHHIPAAVWQITTRGEYYSAYTPYQAEASQGTLQLLYEYQTMMASLMGMEVSNASLYDGATALAEAILMAVRANRNSRSGRILVPGSLHPVYRKVARTLTANQRIELVEVPYDKDSGTTRISALEDYREDDITAVVINQPNFLGRLEDVDRLTNWAHERDALAVAVVNPLAMALLRPPGEWGERGADIACGEGQPLGVPLSSGGPYYGFMTCRKSIVRQMPGRIIGKTVDLDGKPGYTLTLQAREQHIRRSRATSNICTNQGLVVTASTIHMSILGAEGLRQVALQSHLNASALSDKLAAIPGVSIEFPQAPGFHEFVIRLEADARLVLQALTGQGVQAGYDLSGDYPEMKNCLLVCATETKTAADLDRFAGLLEQAVGEQRQQPRPAHSKLA